MEEWKRLTDDQLKSLENTLENIESSVTWLRDNMIRVLDFFEAQYPVDLRSPMAPPTTPVPMPVSPEPVGGSHSGRTGRGDDWSGIRGGGYIRSSRGVCRINHSSGGGSSRGGGGRGGYTRDRKRGGGYRGGRERHADDYH